MCVYPGFTNFFTLFDLFLDIFLDSPALSRIKAVNCNIWLKKFKL